MVPVILAGGAGSRLWPQSRALYPKQFLPLIGSKTMLQETLVRLEGVNAQNPIFVCNEHHRFLVAEQLRQLEIKPTGILLEPFGRNTAPAIALAALFVLEKLGDQTLVVLPADHVIRDVGPFHEAVNTAKKYAEQGFLVTFGLAPVRPEIGYGYIKAGKTVELSTVNEGYSVECFTEKPDLATALNYLEAGNYFWNSGMFVFKASVYLKELEKYNHSIVDACVAALQKAKLDWDFTRIDEEAFKECPEDSIDYAIMEKTDKAIVVPMNCDWSDVGSWSALWELEERDKSGNVLKGDVIAHSTNNCYLQSNFKLLATIGIDNLIVVDTPDAVLVAGKNSIQEVKRIVEQLKGEGRPEFSVHREVYRPWGKYDSIDFGNRFQVKRITVNPGAKLSVQMHHHRAEHWIVVSGTAKVYRESEEFLLTENQSAYIPLGVVHALENPGKIPLEMVEVQSGAYLGEDDIVRFSDRYGRT